MTASLNGPKQKLPKAEDIEKIPSYVFCRWLSGNIYTINAANQINIYSDIPIQNQFHIINKAFGGKIKFIPYPKAHKEETTKSIDVLVKHFKINKELAREYLDVIDENELKQLMEIYG